MIPRRRGMTLGVVCALTLGSALVRAEPPPAEAYQLHCSGCHRADGRGDARIVPTLLELDRLIEAPGGREYVIRVPGVAQAPLPSRDLAALLNWILTELNESNDFVRFDEIEVESFRREPLRDPIGARPALP